MLLQSVTMLLSFKPNPTFSSFLHLRTIEICEFLKWEDREPYDFGHKHFGTYPTNQQTKWHSQISNPWVVQLRERRLNAAYDYLGGITLINN